MPLLQMVCHVRTGHQLLTAGPMKLALDWFQRTVQLQVVLQVLPLYGIGRAVIGAGDRIAFTHRPVSEDDVSMDGRVFSTVVTAERSLGTLLTEVASQCSSSEPAATFIQTLHLHILAAQQLPLLLLLLRTQVEVLGVAAQLSRPLTAQLTVDTADVQLGQGALQVLVVEDSEVLTLAQRAGLVVFHEPTDAVLAEVVPTAADQMRLSEDEQTHSALCLDQGRRGLKEVAVIARLEVVVLRSPDRREADKRQGGVWLLIWEAAARPAVSGGWTTATDIHLFRTNNTQQTANNSERTTASKQQ